MQLADVLLVGALTAGAVSGCLSLILAVDLWRVTLRIPDLPLNVRLNPLNILAYREAWTPTVARASRRLTISAVCMLGFALLAAVIALWRA